MDESGSFIRSGIGRRLSALLAIMLIALGFAFAVALGRAWAEEIEKRLPDAIEELDNAGTMECSESVLEPSSVIVLSDMAAQADWKTELTSNYKKALQLAGRSSFNQYCSLAVSYELRAYGITTSNEALGNGIDAASHFRNTSKTTGGYNVSYTAGSSSGGWSACDTATNYGKRDGIYVVSYTSSSAESAGHASFLVIESGQVYVCESYVYAGNPEGTCMQFGYSTWVSKWKGTGYYNVTGVARFEKPNPTPPLVTIPNGRYVIHTYKEKDLVVEVQDSSTVDDGNIQMNVANLHENQLFDIYKSDNGTYTMENVNSGLVVEILGASTSNNANIVQRAWNTYDRQKWRFRDAGNGAVFIENASTKTLMDAGASPVAGKNVKAWKPEWDLDDSKFVLVPYADFGERTYSLESGYYVMRSAMDKTYAVEAENGGVESGTNLRLSHLRQDDSEIFHFVKHDDGTYTIHPKNTDSVAFDVIGGIFDDAANIRLYTTHGKIAESWILRSCDDGSYALQNVRTGKFFDVAYTVAKENQNIQQYKALGVAGQKFFLEPWTKDVSSPRVDIGSVKSSYDYTGKAVEPKPSSVRWLVNSFDTLEVPDDGNAATHPYNNRGVVRLYAGHTYVIEVASCEHLAGEAPYSEFWSFGDDDQGIESVGCRFQWSNSPQSFTITPKLDALAHLYPGVAGNAVGNQARYNGLKIWEVLDEGEDYKLSYKNNVNAGTATMTVAGMGDFTGTKSASFKIVGAPEPATYTVKFTDGQGKTLKTQKVTSGKAATAPEAPTRSGYTFDGWDKSFNQVTSDLTVNAKWKKSSNSGDSPAKSVTWTRLAGDNAFKTMSKVIDAGSFAKGGTVVLASLEGYWDALTAAGIAGLEKAPVVMATPDGLSPEATVQLKKLAPKKIVVCGGTYWLPQKVLDQAKAAAGTSPSVVRLAGDNAAATAEKIAAQGKGKWSGTAIVATAGTFQDALAAAPVSWAKAMPIFLAQFDSAKESGYISKSTINAMKDAGIKKCYIAGGTYWIPEKVASDLEAAGITVIKRLGGKTAMETSGLIAQEAVAKLGMKAEKMGVANVAQHYDALASASFCGKANSVLVLVKDSRSSVISGFVKSHKASMTKGYVFGGTGSVSSASMTALQTATK